MLNRPRPLRLPYKPQPTLDVDASSKLAKSRTMLSSPTHNNFSPGNETPDNSVLERCLCKLVDILNESKDGAIPDSICETGKAFPSTVSDDISGSQLRSLQGTLDSKSRGNRTEIRPFYLD